MYIHTHTHPYIYIYKIFAVLYTRAICKYLKAPSFACSRSQVYTPCRMYVYTHTPTHNTTYTRTHVRSRRGSGGTYIAAFCERRCTCNASREPACAIATTRNQRLRHLRMRRTVCECVRACVHACSPACHRARFVVRTVVSESARFV